MTEKLRFAEAVCAGHPDRLADTIAERIVALAVSRDPEALVGVEVALHRSVVFVDGRVAAGRSGVAAVDEAEIVAIARQVLADAGYGATPSGVFPPDPGALEVRTDLCLGPLPEDERAIRDVSDDQSICVGHAVWGPRADHRPLEQALATDFAAALERLRVERPDLGLGPDGKTLVTVRGRALVGVSLSVHHAPGVDWVALTRAVRACVRGRGGRVRCVGRARAARSRGRLARQRRRRLRDGRASAATTACRARSSSRRPTARRCRSAAARPSARTRTRSTRAARLSRASSPSSTSARGSAREATVWLAYRPGDVTPRWTEVLTVPDDGDTEDAKFSTRSPSTTTTARG